MCIRNNSPPIKHLPAPLPSGSHRIPRTSNSERDSRHDRETKGQTDDAGTSGLHEEDA